MCYYDPCLTIALQEEEGEGIHCSDQTPLPQWDPGKEGKRGGGEEGRRGGGKEGKRGGGEEGRRGGREAQQP